jgi:hypothetical protein
MPSPKRIRLRDLRKSPGFVTHEQLASVIDAVVLIDEQTGGGGGGAAWFDGAGTPSPGLGNNGDYYLNTTNGDVYEKAGGSWSVVGNIKGPAGTNGTNGTNGVGVPVAGTTGQILAKIDATDYNTEWIDNFTSQVKHQVKAGVALTKGQAVYVTGANGTNIIVGKADNTTEVTSSKTMGLIQTDLANNAFGYVITEGLLAGLDTSAAGAAGDPVWLGTNGNLLYGAANEPLAPAHLVFIGIVTRKQSNNGEIFVNVRNGFSLREIHDVAITSVANNNLLMYESATALWKNKTLSQIITAALGNGISGQLLQTDGAGTFAWSNNNGKQGTFMDATQTSVTGTNAETINKSLLIPANTFDNSTAFTIKARLWRSNEAFNAVIVKIYVSASASSFSGAVLIGSSTISSGAGLSGFIFQRSILISNKTTLSAFHLVTAANSYTDLALSGPYNAVAIDWTVNRYILITTTATNANLTYVNYVRSIQIIAE